jgi:hypothetical protein
MPVSPVVTPSPNVGTHGYITIVDVNGYPIGSVATSDGAQFGSISGESLFLYNNGGPVLASGVPSQLAFDRQRGYLGKGISQAAITTTSVGNTSIVFASAPKTIMPGHAIRITGGSTDEYVIVSPTYVPDAVTTTIPLVSPVVNAGQNLALWDVFSPSGPNNGLFNSVGVGLQALALANYGFTSRLGAAVSAAADGVYPYQVLEVVEGRLGASGSIDRRRASDTFKPFNAQAVTISSANTPTAIWTPTAGKSFRLMGYWFSTTVAAGLIFHDLASVGSGGVMPIPSPVHAAAGVIQSPDIGNGILSAAANNKLWIDATAATTLTGFVWGTEE